MGEQIRKGLFTPENYEISFSSVSDLESINIELSPEERLKLRGRIDRVDTCEDGEQVYVKVIDYKSGNTSFQLLSLYHGLQLQLVIYLNAAMELMKKEHPDKEVLPAGVLYYQLQDPVLDTDGEEADVTARVLEKLKPNGLINADPEIIQRLDQSMPGRSQVLPLPIIRTVPCGPVPQWPAAGSLRHFRVMSTERSRRLVRRCWMAGWM